ncbi:hypothetical protein HNP46_000467 [Pseudomonas nitritireducens]|uniref:Uncharacterized protein n=1 Tax=Pseudomonas nitroreducens TaxID=46680 RepID=A0A7W7KF13_PSENT|nr:hypothetical protein [Pseudomonas nitritireducens]MBB4861656.1 hypothetical protein [Pseudomonas nitritireducens]
MASFSFPNNLYQLLFERHRVQTADSAVSGDLFDEIMGLEKESVPGVFLYSVIAGDLQVAKACWDLHGPFKLNVVGRGTWLQIMRGVEVVEITFPQPLLMVRSPGHVLELLELLKLALDGDDRGAALLHQVLFDVDNGLSAREHLVAGIPDWKIDDLPVLNDGAIERPELLLGLQRLAATRALPALYDHALVWATSRMLEQHLEILTPFGSDLMVEFERRAVDEADRARMGVSVMFSTQPMGKYLAQSFHQTDFMNHTYTGGQWPIDPSRPLRIKRFFLEMAGLGDGMELLDAPVVEALAPKAAAMGFGFNSGMLLCRVKVSDLAAFPMNEPEPARTAHIVKALEGYFPPHLACSLYGATEKAHRAFDLANAFKAVRTEPRELLSLMASNLDVAEAAMKELPAEFLEFVVSDAYRQESKYHVDAKETLLIAKQLGLSLDGLKFKLSEADVDLLFKAGIRFSPGTRIQLLSVVATLGRESGFPMLRQAGAQLSQMGESSLLVGDDEFMLSNADLVKTLSKARTERSLHTNKNLCLEGIAQHRGIEALLPDVRTATNWKMMYRVFGDELMAPVMHLAPESVQTQRMTMAFEL